MKEGIRDHQLCLYLNDLRRIQIKPSTYTWDSIYTLTTTRSYSPVPFPFHRERRAEPLETWFFTWRSTKCWMLIVL